MIDIGPNFISDINEGLNLYQEHKRANMTTPLRLLADDPVGDGKNYLDDDCVTLL